MSKEAAVAVLLLLSSIAAVTFAQDNAGPCTCDLTQSACDPNCCCDTECNATDIGVFSACSNSYSFSSVQSCFPSSIMYRNYTPYTINTSSASGMSCIYYDKFSSRNYFASPQVENSNITKLVLRAQAFAGFNFTTTTVATDYSKYSASYKAGTKIHTIYLAYNPGYLIQPAAGNGPSCSYTAPALFMNSLTTTCTRSVTAATCATDGAIRLSAFVSNFRVVPQPSWLTADNSNSSLLDFNLLTNVTQGALTCRAANGSAVTCSGVPSPAYNNVTGECSFVLTSLTYNIKYRASIGIYEVSYDAVLASYTVRSGYVLTQSFSSAFNLSQSASASAYPRSGNPGYITGKPVLAGTRNTTTNTVQVNSDPTRWLTVPGANSDGSCSAADTASRSVAFGESLQSVCWRQLNYWDSVGGIGATACADLSTAVRTSLAGLGIGGSTVVGRFGNTPDTSLTDWRLIHADNATCAAGLERQANSACTNVMLGGRLTLLVARTGSVTNPQSSIVGALLECVRGNVTIQCAGGSCSSGNATQRFMTSYSVRFVDASSTPTTSLTTPTSIFQQRLMKDFFYLLYVENGAVATTGLSAIWWLLCFTLASHWLA